MYMIAMSMCIACVKLGSLPDEAGTAEWIKDSKIYTKTNWAYSNFDAIDKARSTEKLDMH